MSPSWTPDNESHLRESRRIQAELAESAGLLMTVAQRLSDLVAELNTETDDEEAAGE